MVLCYSLLDLLVGKPGYIGFKVFLLKQPMNQEGRMKKKWLKKYKKKTKKEKERKKKRKKKEKKKKRKKSLLTVCSRSR